MTNDSPAKVSDDVTAAVVRGPMTRPEAIRHILDTCAEAHYLNPPLGPDRAEDALHALGITEDEITEAKDLP